MLSNWENEGGSGAAAPETRHASDDILRNFGQSVVTHWNELPRDFKQTVFRELASKCKEPAAGLKERAARFLHDNGSPLRKGGKRPAWTGPDTFRVGFSEKVRAS
jgi:hypothetical protein